MTLNEDKKKVKANRSVLNKILAGREITNLVVVPSEGSKTTQIAAAINFGSDETMRSMK